MAALAGGIAALAAAYFAFGRKRGDWSSSLLQQQLIAIQDQIRQSLEGTQARLDERLKQNAEQFQQTHRIVGERLDGVTRTVGERLDNAARTVTELGSKMMKVEEATRRVFEVGKDIAGLQQILRAPKVRGGLGEVFLSDILAQMLPQEAYELQYMFADGERADAVIRTAHGLVPVDSKFPLEDFQRMANAQNDDDRKISRKSFTEGVKKRINETAKYIRQGEGTFDFALMYIPAENIYYSIITRDEAYGESAAPVTYAMSKKVIPVSPNTFYAYLNTILLGLKGMKVEKFVSEIITEIGKMRTEFSKFQDDFIKLGKHIGNASSSFESADRRLNRLDDRFASLDQPAIGEGEKTTVVQRLPGYSDVVSS